MSDNYHVEIKDTLSAFIDSIKFALKNTKIAGYRIIEKDSMKVDSEKFVFGGDMDGQYSIVLYWHVDENEKKCN